ncbi:MAG: ParB/RepB/Spo0J family partition protein [Alphaproteobacteria bacterium]
MSDPDRDGPDAAGQAPEWLVTLVHAPAGGVVTPDDRPPPPPPAADLVPQAPARPGDDDSLRSIPVDAITPHPGQPRRSMDEGELHALAASIAEQGVIQPIVVRPVPGDQGSYEIIAGERRWRAARLAGLASVPALVRPLDDRLMAEVALVENIQRSDLPPLDEAAAYQQLIDRHGQTQDDIARRLGKNRSHIAHMLRLLRLPDSVQAEIRDGRISVGHARVLVNAADPEALARRVITEGLTVRQTEEAAKATRHGSSPEQAHGQAPGPSPELPGSQPDSEAWAARLGAALERPVAVKPGRHGGSLVIRYDTEDDLASILARISR